MNRDKDKYHTSLKYSATDEVNVSKVLVNK